MTELPAPQHSSRWLHRKIFISIVVVAVVLLAAVGVFTQPWSKIKLTIRNFNVLGMEVYIIVFVDGEIAVDAIVDPLGNFSTVLWVRQGIHSMDVSGFLESTEHEEHIYQGIIDNRLQSLESFNVGVFDSVSILVGV